MYVGAVEDRIRIIAQENEDRVRQEVPLQLCDKHKEDDQPYSSHDLPRR